MAVSKILQYYPSWSRNGAGPKAHTIEEGGNWLPGRPETKFVSILYADGEIWDSLLEIWRSSFNENTRIPLDPPLQETGPSISPLAWSIEDQDMVDIRKFLNDLRNNTLSRKTFQRLNELLEKYKP